MGLIARVGVDSTPSLADAIDQTPNGRDASKCPATRLQHDWTSLVRGGEPMTRSDGGAVLAINTITPRSQRDSYLGKNVMA